MKSKQVDESLAKPHATRPKKNVNSEWDLKKIITFAVNKQNKNFK